MMYLGGKYRASKWIAPHVAALGRPVWEPFCGGLNMTRRLRSLGVDVEPSDIFEPVVGLYQAVSDGWVPPERLSEPEWRAARALGVGPLWAFSMACSFGGKWGCSYPRSSSKQDYVAGLRRGLLRDCRPGDRFRVVDFLDVEPQPASFAIYADPPYAGTTGYKDRVPFDHPRFWARIRGWESYGVPCLVSEYTAPPDFEVVEARAHKSTVSRDKTTKIRTEKLWRLSAKPLVESELDELVRMTEEVGGYEIP